VASRAATLDGMLRPEILEYYNRGGETTRLDAGTGRLEYLRTLDILTRVLPPAPARILDVGGATGVYARPLTDRGYRVHVIDPVPAHVSAAGAIPGVTAELGDARDLSGHGADAVLLLGPLYHLTDRADRLTAWRAAAAAAPLVVAATISRFASLFDGVVKSLYTGPEIPGRVLETVATGVHHGDHGLFTTSYFHHPDEATAEAREAGLTDVRTLAVEGPLWMTGPRLDEFLADPALTALLLDMLRRVETEPTLAGATSHQLTVARTP
jgi:SAM-dependent methyltransferase